MDCVDSFSSSIQTLNVQQTSTGAFMLEVNINASKRAKLSFHISMQMWYMEVAHTE